MSLPASSPARACASLRAWKAQTWGWLSRRGVRQRRPSTNVKEHKDARSFARVTAERSTERFVDMEVSRKKILDFEGVSRKRGALLYRRQCTRVALRCQYNSLIVLSSDSNDRGFECDRSKGRASSTRTAKRAPLYRRGKKGTRPRLFILCGCGRRCHRGTCRRG